MGGAEAFVEASWTTTHQEGNEEIVAIPWFVDSRALAYRKDVLDQVGLTEEEAFKDMAAFEATLQKVKEANPDMAPFSHTGRGDWNVIQNASMFIWNYGGDILSTDNKQAAFNSEQSVDAVTFAAGLFGKGLTPPDAPEINTTQAENKLAEGSAFSTVTGPWTVGNVNAPADQGGWANREVAENIDFVEFPSGPGGQYAFVGGSQLGIFNECANPEEAVKFVQFLTSQESVVPYTKVAGFLPARLEAQQDPAFNTPAYQVFQSAAEKGKVPPTIAQWGGVENVMRTALEGVWEDVQASGSTPIDEAKVKARLDAGAQSVNELLATNCLCLSCACRDPNGAYPPNTDGAGAVYVVAQSAPRQPPPIPTGTVCWAAALPKYYQRPYYRHRKLVCARSGPGTDQHLYLCLRG
jgi:multiple sugar transport system substrate-binding protein